MRSSRWSVEDDETLARTVLDCVRVGKTQLVGFKQAALILGRTPASCNFRWNDALRHRYDRQLKQCRVSGYKLRRTPDTACVKLSRSIHLQLKELSLASRRNLSDIVDDAVQEYVTKHLQETGVEIG